MFINHQRKRQLTFKNDPRVVCFLKSKMAAMLSQSHFQTMRSFWPQLYYWEGRAPTPLSPASYASVGALVNSI